MSNQPVYVQPSPEDIEQNKFIALFSYLGIFLLIPLLARKDSIFCRYHVNQGLILLIINVVISILSSIIGILSILQIVTLILAIIGIVNCAQGKVVPLPLIGNFQILK